MEAYPAIADCAVTAAAMRAAASIIEESALAGLSVTCDSGQITVQVCEWSGSPAERAAQVGRAPGPLADLHGDLAAVAGHRQPRQR